MRASPGSALHEHRSTDAVVSGQGALIGVRRDRPGSARIETCQGNTEVDAISFAFDDPASMEIQVWGRDPWSDGATEPGRLPMPGPSPARREIGFIPGTKRRTPT